MMKRDLWFPTPVWSGRFDNITEHEFNLAADHCLSEMKKSDGRVYTNVGGWQSNDFDPFDVNHVALSRFFDQIHQNFDQLRRDLDIGRNLRFDNAWININGKNHYNAVHDHPLAWLAGVFYLTDRNSEIVFHRQQDISSWHNKMMGSQMRTPLTFLSANYSPKQGDFFIFPAWLMHNVIPNSNEDTERISIAFNITLV